MTRCATGPRTSSASADSGRARSGNRSSRLIAAAARRFQQQPPVCKPRARPRRTSPPVLPDAASGPPGNQHRLAPGTAPARQHRDLLGVPYSSRRALEQQASAPGYRATCSHNVPGVGIADRATRRSSRGMRRRRRVVAGQARPQIARRRRPCAPRVDAGHANLLDEEMRRHQHQPAHPRILHAAGMDRRDRGPVGMADQHAAPHRRPRPAPAAALLASSCM